MFIKNDMCVRELNSNNCTTDNSTRGIRLCFEPKELMCRKSKLFITRKYQNCSRSIKIINNKLLNDPKRYKNIYNNY